MTETLNLGSLSEYFRMTKVLVIPDVDKNNSCLWSYKTFTYFVVLIMIIKASGLCLKWLNISSVHVWDDIIVKKEKYHEQHLLLSSRVFKASHNAPDEIMTVQSWNLVLLNYFIYTNMTIPFINDKGGFIFSCIQIHLYCIWKVAMIYRSVML